MQFRSLQDVQEFGASLDWLTFTASTDVDEAGEFHRFARDYMQREQTRWSEVKERKIGGYTGLNVHESSWVRRAHDGHEMLVASGETANRLAEEVITYAIPGRCTRIDAQVSARCSGPDWTYPERIRAEIQRARAEEGKLRRKKIALFDSDFGNSGLTVGSRSSSRYVRVYDWDAKHSGGATAKFWRHEAEFKAEAAKAFFNGYRNSTNRSTYCAGVVKRTLESMDIPCSWMADVDAVAVVVGRKITTTEKRLAYMKKVVMPMMLDLYRSGAEDELRTMLQEHGLADLFKT